MNVQHQVHDNCHVWDNLIKYKPEELGICGGVDWEVPLSYPNKINKIKAAMESYGLVYCWFDVLCMPQNKQNEINLEIPFMGDYYAGADITLILYDVLDKVLYMLSNSWGNIRSLFKESRADLVSLSGVISSYKDFVVDYDMNVRDLNKKIVRYAYSKGDLSWMSIGGDFGTHTVLCLH